MKLIPVIAPYDVGDAPGLCEEDGTARLADGLGIEDVGTGCVPPDGCNMLRSGSKVWSNYFGKRNAGSIWFDESERKLD